MSQTRFSFLAVYFLLAVFCLPVFAEKIPDVCQDIDSAAIGRHIPNLPPFTIEGRAAVPGDLCEVMIRLEEDIVPVYVSKDFAIIGDMFAKGDHLTRTSIDARNEAAFKNNRAALAEVTAFIYKPKNATKSLYFITDPDCVYCEKSKKPLKDFADQYGIEIRVVFYPLPMHEGAKEKAEKALCTPMSFEDYLGNKYPDKTCKEGAERVAKGIDLLQKIKINGTPTFITDRGQTIVGFNPDNLRDAL